MSWYISQKFSGAYVFPMEWRLKGLPDAFLNIPYPVRVRFTSLDLLGSSVFGYGFHGNRMEIICNSMEWHGNST